MAYSRERGLTLEWAARWLVVPAAAYFLCFVALTFPLVTQFSSRLWSDQQDAWVMLWNFWWVGKALGELRQLPWHTVLIHYPYGVSLWTHVLTLSNSLLAVGLGPWLSRVESYNLLVLLSFVTAGVTAFWLCYAVIGKAAPALVGGYIFSFSNYHWAQARGQLNLASVQWIPLFVLCWYLLVQKPRKRLAVAAGVTLALVALSDYYYLFYCLLAAALMVIWHAVARRDAWFWARAEYRPALAILGVVGLALVAPLVLPVIWSTVNDPVTGHAAEHNSLDAQAFVVPGRFWWLWAWSRPLWAAWDGSRLENSVAAGATLTALLVGVWFARKRLAQRSLGVWYTLVIVFGILSLGPVLHVGGQIITGLPMPYALLTAAGPLVTGLGMPVRMMVMVVLGAAVIGSGGFVLLTRGARWHRLLAIGVFALLVLETMPHPIATRLPTAPAYVSALRDLPNKGGVIDWIGLSARGKADQGVPPGEMMFYQTVHEKPIAFGYIARIPASTMQTDTALRALIHAGKWDVVCRDYGFAYLAAQPRDRFGSKAVNLPVVYRDREAVIYDFKPGGNCAGE